MFTLHNGDCLEYMKSLQTGSIDAVISDPPYGVDFRGNDWDSFIPSWIEQARRVSKLVVFTTAPVTLWDYPRPDWVACWHRTAAKSRSLQGGFNHWSPIVIYGDVKFPVDVFYNNAMITAMDNKGVNHPTPKPVKLYKWLVANCAQPGGVVLDPFMGSGTTGIACLQLGRRFIGCEISAEYFAVAEKRIKQAALQPGLFTPSLNRLPLDVSGSPAQQALFAAEAEGAEDGVSRRRR